MSASNKSKDRDYSSPSYWDERYATVEECFDWYQDYDNLKPFLLPYLRNEDIEIFIPGCGNSTLGASLYDSNYKNIVNVDTSEVVVQQMRDLYTEKEEMEFTCMDARDMANSIPDSCFDVIIDKALYDVLLCSSQGLENVEELTREMFRILKKGAVLLIVSHAPPNNRLPQLTRNGLFTVDYTTLPRPSLNKLSAETEENPYHYLYACKKVT